MKIKRLRLKNIRCFESLELKLDGQSALIIGDNGHGKSTVMRSIAMGLCDDSSASALFRDLHGETVRKRCSSGRIDLDLDDGSRTYRTSTAIKALRTFERVEQSLTQTKPRPRKMRQNDFPWHRIFAVGYGAGIRVQGTSDYDYYLTVDAVYPLFRYDTLLQNPELIVRRLVDDARRRGREHAAADVLAAVRRHLRIILQLDDDDQVELTRTGIGVRGSDLSSMGDGYRSTVTWVLDLLSWWFLRNARGKYRRDPTAIRGIVLLDEIEQHLHPRWQRNIMRLLTTSFPEVQFIATTHSPLVASGCDGIPVHRLSAGKADVVEPFGWLAEDVYEEMGVPTSRAATFKEFLDRYAALDAKRLRKQLSPNEEREIHVLRNRMASLPPDDPIKLSLELKNLAARANELKAR